jgi:hypothetical protein
MMFTHKRGQLAVAASQARMVTAVRVVATLACLAERLLKLMLGLLQVVAVVVVGRVPAIKAAAVAEQMGRLALRPPEMGAVARKPLGAATAPELAHLRLVNPSVAVTFSTPNTVAVAVAVAIGVAAVLLKQAAVAAQAT